MTVEARTESWRALGDFLSWSSDKLSGDDLEDLCRAKVIHYTCGSLAGCFVCV